MLSCGKTRSRSMPSSLMWLLAGLSPVLAVGWRCQFLATRASPRGRLQHGSWLLSERVIWERKETENAPKTKKCLLILLPVPLTLQQATVNPCFHRRLPNTHRYRRTVCLPFSPYLGQITSELPVGLNESASQLQVSNACCGSWLLYWTAQLWPDLDTRGSQGEQPGLDNVCEDHLADSGAPDKICRQRHLSSNPALPPSGRRMFL